MWWYLDDDEAINLDSRESFTTKNAPSTGEEANARLRRQVQVCTLPKRGAWLAMEALIDEQGGKTRRRSWLVIPFWHPRSLVLVLQSAWNLFAGQTSS